MPISLLQCLSPDTAPTVLTSEHTEWLTTRGWSNRGEVFPRLRSGDCWEDPQGGVWRQHEVLPAAARQEAKRLLKERGWQVHSGKCRQNLPLGSTHDNDWVPLSEGLRLEGLGGTTLEG